MGESCRSGAQALKDFRRISFSNVCRSSLLSTGLARLHVMISVGMQKHAKAMDAERYLDRMRLEYNHINWPRIQKQLDEAGKAASRPCVDLAAQVKWMSAESRESQAVKDSKAAICPEPNCLFDSAPSKPLCTRHACLTPFFFSLA